MLYLSKIEASYQLKQILPTSPLFHATDAAVQILAHGEGVRAGKGSRFGAGNYESISMTRDLSLLLDRRFGHTILVFDRNELKTKFKIKPHQYQPSGWDDEKEERVLAEHISSSYIKAMIMLIKPHKDKKTGKVEYVDNWPQTVKYIYLDRTTKKIEVYN